MVSDHGTHICREQRMKRHVLQNEAHEKRVPKNSALSWGNKPRMPALFSAPPSPAHADCFAAVWLTPAEAAPVSAGLGMTAGI